MNIFKGILAVIAGLLCGSIVNMGIIVLGGSVIPPPAGVDVTNMESLRASMHLFQAQHFIAPFLAHALGTLVGALIAAIIAPSRKLIFAMAIGFLFMIGGVVNIFLLNGPVWFSVLDIVAAYIPMAWLGWRLSGK